MGRGVRRRVWRASHTGPNRPRRCVARRFGKRSVAEGRLWAVSLVVDSISKRFDAIQALDGVSFEVEPGRIFGLLGANGAGKTTSMRIVLDILRPDSGTVTWQGTPNIELPRDTWSYLPEERGLYMRMTVMDVLRFFAALYGVPD